MIERPLLTGRLVRLVAMDPERDADDFSRWSKDSEYSRLLDSEPAAPWLGRLFKAEVEKEEIKNTAFLFDIRTLVEDRLIGMVDLGGIEWNHGDAFVGIGIGEHELWGKGYGTDAMREVLRFAFDELNLHRVSLDVFEYNPRGYQSYLKCGFKEEGRARQFLQRDGRRWDLIYMGILHSEWEEARAAWES